MGDELISRQAAIEACLNGWNYDMETIEHIQDNISRLPSVQPKTGQWVKYPDCYGCFKCSECGMLSLNRLRYCYGCGAKMEERVEQVSERGGNG